MMMARMMQRFGYVLCMLFFLFSTAFASDVQISSPDLFPIPIDLEDAVKFWIKIYSKYSTNDYVIHDASRMTVIYEVVRWDSGDDDPIDLPQTRSQRNYLKQKKSQYRTLLLQLASTNTNFEQLEGEVKRIFELFGGTTDLAVYHAAAENIRIQRGQRDRFLNGLQLSGRYMDYIKQIFKKYDLPEELTYLPHVESSFNYRAYSTAGAAGIWQFTRRTGRRFLKINYEIDERLDPILATEAAAKLLKENYNELGTWPLAITAYNHGQEGMKRATRILNTTDFSLIVEQYQSRYFKFASRNFYCEFLAALHVSQHHADYFGDVTFETPIQFAEFELPNYIKIATVANNFKLEIEDIQKYNPALRNPIFSGSKYLPKGYRLRLPAYLNPEQLYTQIPANDLFVAQKPAQWYRVRSGDTLEQIAKRLDTSVTTLIALNDISDAHRLRVGDVLRLPDQTETVAVNLPPKVEPTQPLPLPAKVEVGLGGSEIIRAPQPDLAAAIKPKIERQLNPAVVRVAIAPEIELAPNSNPVVGYIRIEPEETLGHYSEWLKIPTQKIRNWNQMSYGKELQLGQRIKLIFENVSAEEFNAARLEYHRGIEEDFFGNYKVLGTFTHKLKKGENIWYLCNNIYNLPYWLIKSYNNDLKLDALKPGDLILIPEVAGNDASL